MKQIECSGLERGVILEVYRKPKRISDIAKSMGKSIHIISKIISRMEDQGLISRKINYVKDARVSEISLDSKRIEIAKTHTFYFRYFLIVAILFFISLVTSFILEIYFFIVGVAVGILIPLIYMFYNAYIAEDKVVVYKTPKLMIKKSINKVVDNVHNQVDNS